MKDFLYKNLKIQNLLKFRHVLLPAVLCLLFFVALAFYNILGNFLKNYGIIASPIHEQQLSPYPIASIQDTPDISAQAALVMDATSKVVLYSKNADLRFSPASTTKIMTFITAFEYFKPDDVLTIKSSNVEPVIIGFVPGQQVTFKNLLLGMLIPSGNDAALAISQNYPGGEDAFIAAMNENTKKLHLQNTHFGDPVGLTDDETYTTVSDLSKIVSGALENPLFKQIVAMKTATVRTVDGTVYPVKTTNLLLGLYGINGVKTGFTEGAKEVLVTSAVRNGHTFIIIVMKSDDRFADTKVLLDSVVDKTSFLSIHL